MSNRKRPSMKDALGDVIAQIRPVGSAPEPPPEPPAADAETDRVADAATPEALEIAAEYWQKFTLPLRADQLRDLNDLIARWSLERRVKVNVAETIRLALDQLLAQMQQDPDGVLLALYEQEQREQHKAAGRRGGSARGLERYLRKKRLISE